ncbi:MAG TPA: hypothetical protein VIO43_02315 [Lutibacter sp.]
MKEKDPSKSEFVSKSVFFTEIVTNAKGSSLISLSKTTPSIFPFFEKSSTREPTSKDWLYKKALEKIKIEVINPALI